MFENILKNPGLQHIAENIFFNLDVEHLQIFGLINQSSKQILDGPMFQDPMFWLKQFGSFSVKNQKDWDDVIQTVHNSDKSKYAIIFYLRWNLKKGVLIDLPCYTTHSAQLDLKRKILEICMKQNSSHEETEIVKILAPLINDAKLFAKYFAITRYGNPDIFTGRTPIDYAAVNGHTEIVKILASLTDNPNAPGRYRRTPIDSTAVNG